MRRCWHRPLKRAVLVLDRRECIKRCGEYRARCPFRQMFMKRTVPSFCKRYPRMRSAACTSARRQRRPLDVDIRKMPRLLGFSWMQSRFNAGWYVRDRFDTDLDLEWRDVFRWPFLALLVKPRFSLKLQASPSYT